MQMSEQALAPSYAHMRFINRLQRIIQYVRVDTSHFDKPVHTNILNLICRMKYMTARTNIC